ncbi:MAG: rod shape-determining protein MreD [bacterium]|nr:rod shape-determining protein MreD [bacterium]
MVKKIIFFILIFYILTLIQTSFLVHFNILGITPNLVLIAVIFINIFNSSQWQKISSAIIGGFYLDIFSLNNVGGFFGFYTLILLGFSLLLKIILEKYVRIPVIRQI